MPRLPQPGGDDGNWGSILNDYLSQAHNTDGTLKDSVVSGSVLQDTSISAPKLDAGTGTDAQVLTKDSTSVSGMKWAPASGGTATLGGDLSGTLSNAQLNAGVVDTAALADNAVIDAKITTGTITEAKLAAAVQTKLNAGVADASLTPVKLNSDTPATGEILSYNGTGFEWVTAPAAGGGGEANTASNIGTAGVGIYKQKTGVDLELKKLNSGSTKITLTDDTVNNTVDVDVSEANLNLANIGGSLPQSSVNGLNTALAGKVDTSSVGAANGVASLDNTGKVPSAQLPTISSSVTSVAGRTGDVVLTKSDVGLANVDNTSDTSKPVSSATQTALNGKANSVHTHAIADVTSLQTSLDAKADDSAVVHDSGDETVAGIKTFSSSPVVPTPGSSSQAANKSYVDAVAATGSAWDGVLLDSFAGATDDDKLTAALAYQSSTDGRPAILMSARSYTFNQTRNLYSGLKLVGAKAGPRNMELSSGAFVPTQVTLGASITSGTGSWWVPPAGGGDVYDVYMAEFGVQGNSGSSVHQFLDYPVGTGTMYACQFHALSFNFMRGVFGRKDRKCAITQVVFSGHWTANNLWDTQFYLGGSDNQLWVGGMINIGPSSSPLQTGTYADGDYEMIFDGLSKTDIGYIYMSALNGWRGIKIGSTNSWGMSFFGGTYEGYNSSTSRAPGTVIRIEGGQGTFFGSRIGQAMMSPDVAEGGYVHMTAGEWNFVGPQFYRGSTADTVPVIYQTGGRLSVMGATKLGSETWTTRPILQTGAAGGNAADSGDYSTYVPDLSMNVT
jgi:hypothetical protein